MRTPTGVDQYDVESGSNVDACLPSHSRSSLWVGLIGAVLFLAAIIAWAEDPLLYIGSAVSFVVAVYCFFRLFVLKPSSKTTHNPERTRAVVSRPAPSAPTLAIHASPPPPYAAAVCDDHVVNLEELLNCHELAAYAIAYLHRLQKQLEDGVAIAPEPALGRYCLDLQHLVNNAGTILKIFTNWGRFAGLLAMLPSSHLIELVHEYAQDLAQDYTPESLTRFMMASHIGEGLHGDLPENLLVIWSEACDIADGATYAFDAAMRRHLQQMYEQVCNGTEWALVAEALQIWADEYDWFYVYWHAVWPDMETLDAYLSHVYAFISE